MAVMPVMRVVAMVGMPRIMTVTVAMRTLGHSGWASEGHEDGAEGIEGRQPGSDERHPEENLPCLRPIESIEADGNPRRLCAVRSKAGQMVSLGGRG